MMVKELGTNMQLTGFRTLLLATAMFFPCFTSIDAVAQRPRDKKPSTPGPMLEQGLVDYDTPDFTLTLVRSSQTVAALKPKGAEGFDFTPGDLLRARSQNGYFHLGDVTLRLRTEGLMRRSRLLPC